MQTTTPQRSFVPRAVDVSDWSQLQPLFAELRDRPINSPAELERWLLDLSELASVVDEYGTRRYIDKSCHTEDPRIEARYMQFVEQIEPKVKPMMFELQKRFLDSTYRSQLTDRRYQMLARLWQPEVEIFRDENVPLETRITKVVNEYDKICGAMMVDFRGKQYTMQQMMRFLEEPDRALREEASRSIIARRLNERTRIDELFDTILPIRQQIAANAGLSDYREYIWKALKRFDYTPDDCLKFADAVAETVVPLMREIDKERARDLGVEKLRPWDTSVDPKKRPPLRPFAESEVDSFIEKTRVIFDRLSPELGRQFDSLRQNRNLDLASRKGKQPGGYQSTLYESHQTFIFMNAAGVQRDVETLLHEGGHAFHALATFESEPLKFLREPGMEFCEVASMSMELLGAEHLDVFYNPADHARAKERHLTRIIELLAWIVRIDSFQHWIYTHPGHSSQERTREWLRLSDRFGSDIDWTGLEDAKASTWQMQLHLFHVPFYYIEYGIAQLGALQLWLKSKDDPQRALGNYRAALSLGATRTLPELFNAAGIQFDFSEKTLAPLMQRVREEIAGLED